MTFCDHDTRDAIRRLSVPERETPFVLNRRRFLQGVGAIGAGAAMATAMPSWAQEAYAAPPIGANDGVLVVLFKAGGNDSLNMVVPYADGAYYQKRGPVAIPQSSVLPLDARVGFNPKLTYLKSLFEAGQVAVVQGVGYPNSDLSHFVAMADWMRAWSGSGHPPTGWLGRYLDGLGGTGDPLHAIHLGSSIPLHLIGANRRASALQTNPPVGSSTQAWDVRVFDAIRQFAATPIRTWTAGRRRRPHPARPDGSRRVGEVGVHAGPSEGEAGRPDDAGGAANQRQPRDSGDLADLG